MNAHQDDAASLRAEVERLKGILRSLLFVLPASNREQIEEIVRRGLQAEAPKE